VTDQLPQKMRPVVANRMKAAYAMGSELEAHAALQLLARELDRTRPGAAASLREGLDETLTVLRLNVPPTLAASLRSTNPIESMIEICRDHARNVKRWQGGQMVLRWCAAGMIEAAGQFRRVKGFLHLPKLAAELERVTAEHVAPDHHTDITEAA
jgi:transposase-like protein